MFAAEKAGWGTASSLGRADADDPSTVLADLRRRTADLERQLAQAHAALAVVRDGAGTGDDEARFRQLIQTAGGVILVLGPDGIVQEINREAERMLALPAVAALGCPWHAVLDEPPSGAFAQKLAVVRGGSAVRDFEHAIHDRQGNTRVLLWNMSRLFEGAGRGAGIVCVAQDITRRTQAELALRQAHDDLECRVEARTYALRQEIQDRKRAEKALVRAKRLAEEASQAKSDFLATMSHELRTPLNAIIGFADMMGSEMLGPLGHPKYRDYAQIIGSSGSHLLNIINDILDLAKIEAGRMEIHPAPMRIDDAVESSLWLVRDRAAQGGLELEVSVPDDIPVIQADPLRVKQILLNLLTNAVKFTPFGGRVTLSVRHDADAGVVVASVADTGVGMGPDDIVTSLQPFGQVTNELSREAGGTGLGLPLVKSFMALHGGTMAIDSELGLGTTVTLRFPVAG